jgi:hypothetical protein
MASAAMSSSCVILRHAEYQWPDRLAIAAWNSAFVGASFCRITATIEPLMSGRRFWLALQKKGSDPIFLENGV